MLKKLTILSFIGVMLFFVFGISGCESKGSAAQRIERICGIELPMDKEEVYSYISSTWNGVARQYTVYKFKSEPTQFLISDFSYGGEHETTIDGIKIYKPVISGTLAFTGERDSAYEEEFDQDVSGIGVIKNGKTVKIIPKEFYPNWNNNYFREINNKAESVRMVYFPDILTLVIFIRGH